MYEMIVCTVEMDAGKLIGGDKGVSCVGVGGMTFVMGEPGQSCQRLWIKGPI